MRSRWVLCGMFLVLVCATVRAEEAAAAEADKPALPPVTLAPKRPGAKYGRVGHWSPKFVRTKVEADDDDDDSTMWKNRNRRTGKKNRNSDEESEDASVKNRRGMLERVRRDRLGYEDDDDDDGRRKTDFKDLEDQFEVDDD